MMIEGADDLPQRLPVVLVPHVVFYKERKLGIKPPYDFTGQLHVWHLIFAYRHKQFLPWVAIHYDVRSLEQRIAQESVCAEVTVFQIVDLLFVRGNALEPGERRNHRQN